MATLWPICEFLTLPHWQHAAILGEIFLGGISQDGGHDGHCLVVPELLNVQVISRRSGLAAQS